MAIEELLDTFALIRRLKREVRDQTSDPSRDIMYYLRGGKATGGNIQRLFLLLLEHSSERVISVVHFKKKEGVGRLVLGWKVEL